MLKAAKADGGRHCDGCVYYNNDKQRGECSSKMLRLCSWIYKQGYVKGYKDKTKEYAQT